MKTPDDITGTITDALMKLVSEIPKSAERPSRTPADKAQKIASSAARKAAAVSGGLSLPGGPVGALTILPDLLLIWRLQQQMVADIAAVYGRTPVLDQRTMVYCLFKHGGAAFVRDLVARAGTRVLVKHATLAMMQNVLKKVGIRVAQKVLGRSITRLIPLVGAAAVAGYAYQDTIKVAATAIELFSRNLELEPAPSL